MLCCERKGRRERRDILKQAGATEKPCCVRRWQLNYRKDKQKTVVAAARKFHSVLIRVQVRNGKEWKSMICIADTGSGVTIFWLTDLSTAIAEYGIEAPCDDLATADGSTLQGLCGQTVAAMRFHEGSKVHTVPTSPLIPLSVIAPSGIF